MPGDFNSMTPEKQRSYLDAYWKMIDANPYKNNKDVASKEMVSKLTQRGQQLEQQYQSSTLKKEGDDMRLPIPEYKIPTEVGQAMGIYKDMSRQGLPGESVIRDRIMEGYSGAVGNVNRAADSSASALGAMSGLYGRAMGAIRDLGVQSAQVKQRNQQNYANALSTVSAPYTDKAWEYNYNLPYQRGENAYWNLRSAADQYKFKALDSQAANARYDEALAIQNQNVWMDRIFSMLPSFGNFGGGNKQMATPPTFNAYNPTPSAPPINLGTSIPVGAYNPPYNYNFGG